MDYAQALAAIRGLENGSELASAIETHVGGINSTLDAEKTKNYTLIGEKRTATDKAKTLESAVTTMAKSVGIEGSADEVLEKLPGKVSDLSKSLTTSTTAAQDWEKKAKEWEQKFTDSSRSLVFAKAQGHGVNTDALKTLMGEMPIERLKISDEGVAIASEDGKSETPLKEYAEKEMSWIVPSLLTQRKPGGNNGKQGTNTSSLPTGGGNGGNDNKPDLFKQSADKFFGGAAALATPAKTS